MGIKNIQSLQIQKNLKTNYQKQIIQIKKQEAKIMQLILIKIILIYRLNKIYLMKKLQQIKGYGQHEPAHTVPISSIKQLQQKHAKSQSLIQKCMKSLIKQKLSGFLINMDRKKRQYQQKTKSTNINKQSQPNFSGINRYLNNSIKNTRYQNPQLTPLLDLPKTQHHRHQSTVATIKDRIIPQTTKNRYSLINQVQSVLKRKNKQQNTIQNLRKNVNISFISAIDQHQEQNRAEIQQNRNNNNSSPDQKIQLRHLKLPKIRNNNRNSVIVSPTTLPKILTKKSPGYNVNQDLWKILTNQFQSKQRTRKLSNSQTDIFGLQSSNASIPKQIKSSLFKPTIPSSTRQNFQQYINSLSVPFKRLLQFVLSFFQIKIPSQLSIMYYSEMLQYLNSIHDRGWSVVAFIFWDIGKDGVVTSRDIFDIFREWNAFTDRSKNNIQSNQQNKQDIPTKAHSKQKSNAPKKHRKQSLLNMQNIQNALKQFKIKQDQPISLQRNQTISTKYPQQQINIRTYINSLQPIQKCIKLFNQQINRLNNLLSSTSYQQINVQQYKQPQQRTVSYLQQIALSNPNLTYHQITPLFNAGNSNTTPQPTQHKLQPSKKQLSIKHASSYLQCFISTQHNQQTRLSKQKIQNYKLQLQKIRNIKNTILENKINQNIKICKQINYVKVAESGMGVSIKDMVLNLLGFVQ